MKQKFNLFIHFIMLGVLPCFFVHADNGLTDQDRTNLKEITQDRAQEIFHTTSTITDQTVRYTTVMQMLRELNDKAQNGADKALVHAATKNVEEQYRVLLTQATQTAGVASSTQANVVYLNERERESLTQLLTLDVATILREPDSELEAAQRRDHLLKKLRELNKENLSLEDKQLIEQVRSKILDAFTTWKQQYQQSSQQVIPTTVSATVASEMPPMEEGPAAPPLEEQSVASEEDIPTAPPLEPETNKPQVARPVRSGLKPQQPQSDREELLKTIREGKKLRSVKERIKQEATTPFTGRSKMASKTGNVPFSQSEEFRQKLRARRQVIEEEPEEPKIAATSEKNEESSDAWDTE